jgi:hypothetical protein
MSGQWLINSNIEGVIIMKIPKMMWPMVINNEKKMSLIII